MSKGKYWSGVVMFYVPIIASISLMVFTLHRYHVLFNFLKFATIWTLVVITVFNGWKLMYWNSNGRDLS